MFKTTILKTLIRWRRAFMLIAIASAGFALCTLATGCGVPVWLSDAGNIIAMVSASFTSIASFIAGLTGNIALAAALAAVSAWITKVQAGVADLETLITQYQASPNPGLLGDIEASLTDLQTNVQQDFSNLGLPASILSVIAGIAGVAKNLLVQWSNAIAGVKTAKSSAEFKTAMAKLTTLADGLPQTMKQYTVDVNKVLTTKTGDPMVDAALAKVRKFEPPFPRPVPVVPEPPNPQS